jgi:hypothetical protein
MAEPRRGIHVESFSDYQSLLSRYFRAGGFTVPGAGLYSAEALAEQKRVRKLLTQSRELLKQMQAG